MLAILVLVAITFLRFLLMLMLGYQLSTANIHVSSCPALPECCTTGN
jgi:hypothetical protein